MTSFVVLLVADDEHDDEHDDAESSYVPDFTLREGVEWPAAVSRDDTDTGDPDGWQSVLPGGKVSGENMAKVLAAAMCYLQMSK